MLRDEWLALGVEQGWCGPPVCSTHNGTPTTWDEDADFDGGGDPCVHVVRPYRDDVEKDAVERNHGPSVWRRTNAEPLTHEEVLAYPMTKTQFPDNWGMSG